MAMAYGGTAKVSDAAKRAMVSDDPKARAELKEKRDQEFGTMDQIGLAADMLPGGAIAAGGAKAALSGGRNIYKMINDSIKGFKAGGDKSAKDAVLNWASSTDLYILTDALNYINNLSGKALEEIKPAKKAIEDVYNQFSAPKEPLLDKFSMGAKPADSADSQSALEFVKELKAKPVETSKATEEIMATKDLPASTRMSRDMPPLTGKSRISDKLEGRPPGLSFEQFKISRDSHNRMTDEQLIKAIKDSRATIKGLLKEFGPDNPNLPKIRDNLRNSEAQAKARGIDLDSIAWDAPSGRNRVDQSGLEGLSFNVEDISSMTDDQVKYWIELESNMKPMDASTTQRQNEKLRLLMQEAKKRGLR